MKRPTMLAEAILQQQALDLGLSVERDVRTLARRVEHEGEGFLTLTLPLLSDALERGLEECRFSCPTQFRGRGSLPVFLSGFFNLVFDTDGKLLENPSVDAIRSIRQICRFFKKLKKPCSEARERKAIRGYLEVEGELRRRTDEVERTDHVLDTISRLLWTRVFHDFDPISLICRHGPGVTANRDLSNERNRIKHWDDRAELSFPSDLHCFPNYGYACGDYHQEGAAYDNGIEYHSISGEAGVRVVFVPKTQAAPRVIAIEPAHKQFMQQGLLTYVVRKLESDPLTRKSLRFSDQRPNQRLAYRSSIDRRLATLDLKDASDRVHLHLVQRIFRDSQILENLEDSRSLHATLPDERNLVLTKFASMGSAMCFPVEAMVFYTLVQCAMHRADGIFPSYKSIKAFSAKIDIYGDDIIVPVEYTDVVVQHLESYALKVNVNKSFRHSLFRESCGADFFNGTDVKPVYARQEAPDDARKWLPEHVMAWTATANLLYMTGQWHAAQVVRDMVSQVVGKPIPRCRSLGSGVFFFSLLYSTKLRYNTELHCWKQKRIDYTVLKRKDIIDGDPIACLNLALRPRKSEVLDSCDRTSIYCTFFEEQQKFWSNDGNPWTNGLLGQSQERDPTVEFLGNLRRVHDSLDQLGENLEGSERSLGSEVVSFTTHRRPAVSRRDDRDSSKARGVLNMECKSLGTDFLASTYRGRYKPKYRWFTVSQP